MSLLSEEVLLVLKELFPYTKIVPEYHVDFNGQKLFVDFFLPSYLIAVEVHGRQHDEFVAHFHSDYDGWTRHKRRDRIKEDWAMENDITYVVLRERDLPLDKASLLKRIEEIQNVR